MIQNRPGPRSPTYRPRRNITARSHWLATLGDCDAIDPTSRPTMSHVGEPVTIEAVVPAAASRRKMDTATTLMRTDAPSGSTSDLSVFLPIITAMLLGERIEL